MVFSEISLHEILFNEIQYERNDFSIIVNVHINFLFICHESIHLVPMVDIYYTYMQEKSNIA